MNLQTLDSVSERSTWDRWLGTIDGDTLGQTSAWGTTKQGNVSSTIVGLRDGPDIVAGCLLFRRRVGPIDLAYAPRGPVIAQTHRHKSVDIVAGLIDHLSARRPTVLIVQPLSEPIELQSALSSHGFTTAPIDIATPATVEVSLTDEPDVLLSRMRSSRRRNIRKAERAGLIVRRGSDDDLPTFHKLHSNTALRQGFEPLSLLYLERQWEALGQRGALSLYLAELDGVALSAATVTTFGDRAVFKLAGLANSDSARDTRASDYLHWRIMLDAKQRGFALYDLGGFDKGAAIVIANGGHTPDHVRESASQFKLGFGGDVRLLPEARWRIAPSLLARSQRPLAYAIRELEPLQRAIAGLRQ